MQGGQPKPALRAPCALRRRGWLPPAYSVSRQSHGERLQTPIGSWLCAARGPLLDVCALGSSICDLLHVDRNGRWSATLPVRALCCSAIGRRVFIGTLDGTLQIDAERGAFVKHYGQLPAVEILTVDTDTASILAARSDTGDIRVLEVPRE